MKTGFFVANAVILGAAGVFCAASAASADTATPLSVSGRADTQTSATVQTKLATQFSGFAGSEANAQSLITGLRNGAPITLAASGQASPPLTIDTPTRPMGYGNVTISLALARQQLANQGITQPTPQQIQAALTGGTVTTGSGAAVRTVELPGILTMRGSGMGWGKIARSQGMNLGKVMSGVRSPVLPPVAAAVPGRGIVTATGAPAGIHRASGEQEVENSAERQFERDGRASFSRAANAGPTARSDSLSGARTEAPQTMMGRGIVTGAGTAVAATGAAEFGRGRYSSAAVVTAGGGMAMVRGQSAEISHGRR